MLVLCAKSKQGYARQTWCYAIIAVFPEKVNIRQPTMPEGQIPSKQEPSSWQPEGQGFEPPILHSDKGFYHRLPKTHYFLLAAGSIFIFRSADFVQAKAGLPFTETTHDLQKPPMHAHLKAKVLSRFS